MTAKEALYQKLNAFYRESQEGFTTLDCERFTATSRSVISLYLNQLCEEGWLRKDNTRPVRFWLTEKAPTSLSPVCVTDGFSSLIGADGSLKHALSLCLAAVNYPDGGLPVMLNGESGVGKSFLAQLLHQYAAEHGVVPRNARLVELNCADYANNPELLSGALFGYIKGAFTGADKNKTGLLDEADGGFLFLDEVHRLSAENQEKLFLFMDKGYFYRLGDNRQPCQARVRFVFATTENSENVLLTTFKRRIPVTIELPSWGTRPFMEKLALISRFFALECGRFKREIRVDGALIHQLINTPVKGNIGELKNRIKVLCASAFAQHNNGTIFVHAESRLRNDADYIVFSPEDMQAPLQHLTQRYALQDDNLLESFCRTGNVPLFIRKQEEQLRQFSGMETDESMYQGIIWHVIRDALVEFRELTGVVVGPVMEKALFHCLHYCLKASADAEMVHYWLDVTSWVPQKARLLADECLAKLEKSLPSRDIALMQPLLRALFCHQVAPEPLIQGIIVSHGHSTASSIAGTANTLLGGFYLKAFDMPVSVNTRGIISHLTNWITQLEEQTGMIIMVDMGSLQDIYSEIKLHIQGDLLVMNNVSTAMALDIAEKIQQQLTMKEIVDSIKGAWEVEARYYSGIVQGNKIIISCISGRGVAQQLREIVRRYISDESIDVVTMEYDDLKWKLTKADSALFGTRLLITTTDLDARYIPQITTRQLISEKPDHLWKNYFSSLLPATSLESMVDEIVILFTVEGVASHLSFLNPSVIIDEVENVVKFFELTYGIHFESYLRINLFMHLAAMIERLLTHDGMKHRDEFELSAPQKAFMALIPEAFRTLITKYRISLTTTESLMIYELIEPWITAPTTSLVFKAERDGV